MEPALCEIYHESVFYDFREPSTAVSRPLSTASVVLAMEDMDPLITVTHRARETRRRNVEVVGQMRSTRSVSFKIISYIHL